MCERERDYEGLFLYLVSDYGERLVGLAKRSRGS